MRRDKQMADVETKFYLIKQSRTNIVLTNQNDGFRGNVTDIVHQNVCNKSFNSMLPLNYMRLMLNVEYWLSIKPYLNLIAMFMNSIFMSNFFLMQCIRLHLQIGQNICCQLLAILKQHKNQVHILYLLIWRCVEWEKIVSGSIFFLHRINRLKFGQLLQIKNKPKLTKLCKFTRVMQYHATPPGWPFITVIQIKWCYFISVIIIQFCRPYGLVMCIYYLFMLNWQILCTTVSTMVLWEIKNLESWTFHYSMILLSQELLSIWKNIRIICPRAVWISNFKCSN